MSTEVYVNFVCNTRISKWVPISWIQDFEESIFRKYPKKTYLCFYTLNNNVEPNFIIHQLAKKWHRWGSTRLYMVTVKEILHKKKSKMKYKLFLFCFLYYKNIKKKKTVILGKLCVELDST